MSTFATLVLYERHGHPAIGYRTETIDQIAHGEMAEGTRGAWELRCWTPANPRPGYGVTADELVALLGATFRTISHCFDGSRAPDAIQRFHCGPDGAVVDLPSGAPLAEHLANWATGAKPNAAFLQTRQTGTDQLRSIEQALQLELEAMMTTRDELTKWPKPAVRT